MNHKLHFVYYENINPQQNPNIFPSSIRKYFSDTYPHPVFHNHTPDGKSIYRSRGAPFQFKVINNEVCILALNEGVEFAKSFQWPETINFPLGNNGKHFKLKLNLKIDANATFRESDIVCYRNISPYIALNQNNFRKYIELNDSEKRNSIEQGLTNHILTAAKWCGVDLKHRIKINLIQMKQNKDLKIKDKLYFVPFDVMFECNTDIPNYFGIGKFVSRGYGTMVKYG